MASDDNPSELGPIRRAAAFGVHVLTASGAAFALLAMLAAIERHWTLMFLWLGGALFVDGIDGLFARRLNVRGVVPRWSGEVLDLVVDILTYVFVPAYAITVGGLLPEAAALWAGIAIVCTGVLYFADTRMKTADNYFLGFPAAWNLVAFYLFVLRPNEWLALGAVAGLCLLTFVPLPFVHPMRVSRLRLLSIALLALWGALGAAALASGLAPAPWVGGGLLAIGLYFFAAGFLRGRTGA